MKSTGLTTRLRRVLAHVPPRLAGAAVSVLALAASLLVTASPAGAAVANYNPCPVVWNGTDLVTASISAHYQLFAYEQLPGASKWTAQLVAKKAPDDEPLVSVSMTATATSVQIVAEDAIGQIWFFQQADGVSTWSRGQSVGGATLGNAEGFQTPQIAWTGVPGHTGTNSVITVAGGSGNVQFWYQNPAGGWTQQTVADGSTSDSYYDVALTATDRGIVIGALETGGGFQAFFEAYGAPPPWTLDGGVDVGSGQSFGSISMTWDGTNVDVAAAYTSGPGEVSDNEVMFLWEADGGPGWNQDVVMGPENYSFYLPAITYTGSNLLNTSNQPLTERKTRLDFWWQGSTFTDFTRESVSYTPRPHEFGYPQLTYTAGAGSPETAIVAPVTSNEGTSWGVNDWTEPLGGITWTWHVVTSP
jgi:hypothetical protein